MLNISQDEHKSCTPYLLQQDSFKKKTNLDQLHLTCIFLLLVSQSIVIIVKEHHLYLDMTSLCNLQTISWQYLFQWSSSCFIMNLSEQISFLFSCNVSPSETPQLDISVMKSEPLAIAVPMTIFYSIIFLCGVWTFNYCSSTTHHNTSHRVLRVCWQQMIHSHGVNHLLFLLCSTGLIQWCEHSDAPLGCSYESQCHSFLPSQLGHIRYTLL